MSRQPRQRAIPELTDNEFAPPPAPPALPQYRRNFAPAHEARRPSVVATDINDDDLILWACDSCGKEIVVQSGATNMGEALYCFDCGDRLFGPPADEPEVAQ